MTAFRGSLGFRKGAVKGQKRWEMKKLILLTVVAVVVGMGGFVMGLRMNGLALPDAVEMARNVFKARTVSRTTEGVVAEIEKAKPHLAALARDAGAKLRINVFKEERLVELSSPGWKAPIVYPMTAFSGSLGPKLREGDGQIPEGIYRVEYMNPNSSYHLSFKVSYPNAFDREMAVKDGRTKLGGDIMIHGSCATVGCVPIGDDAIDDVFYIVAKVGFRNVEIVMAPYDMRKGRRRELEESPLAWYPRLCDDICKALNEDCLGPSIHAPLIPLEAQQGADHANIERFIAFQKRHSPEMKDADIGKAIILLGAPLYVCTYFKNGGQHETFDFSADDKRYYVDKFVMGNEPVRQELLKLLMDEPASEIPENAFQAYIQLGLVEKFNSMYQERLRSDRSDLHVDSDEGQLSIMLRENGCTNGTMTAYTQLDAHYGVPCVSVVLASCDGGEVFSVARALDDKDSSGIYLSTMFSRDMKSYSVGVVFADCLLRRIPHKLHLHVHVPGHGIVTFNLYNRLKSDGAKGGVDGRLFSAVRGLQGRT